MKSKELLKLNEQHSLVEISNNDGEISQYCVCSHYNADAPEGSKWSWGHYFSNLEDAIKYAALRCFAPIHRYVLIETDTCNNITQDVFYDYEDAYAEFKKRFDEYASYSECRHAEIVDDGNGNTVGELWFDDEDYEGYLADIELKIIDVIV